jgi:uncharacterized protein YecT (DUF1311 family)
MKNCLFVFLLFLSAAKISAQVKEHPIDKQLRRCLDSSQNYTTSGMIGCEYQAYEDWDKELNRNYKLLMTALDADGKAKLKEAQISWLAFRESNFSFIKDIYGKKQGTMWRPVEVDEKVEIVKGRAIELKKYCELLKLY